MNFLRVTLSVVVIGIAMIMGTSYPVSAQNWVHVPGIEAQDISIGKGGVVWATGKDGKDIYRWTGSTWESMSGGASRIAVDLDGTAWVVNSYGQIYKYSNKIKNWELKPGGAKDIAVSANGTIWAIGMNQIGGGYSIHRWNGTDWTGVPGAAVRVAADPSGNAWVANGTFNLFTWNGTSFVQRTGQVQVWDLDIGANGATWCTSPDQKIYELVNNNWVLRNGNGVVKIAVSPDGNPWIVNSVGQVYRVGPAETVKVKSLFPRRQDWEFKALKAMGYHKFMSLSGGTIIPYNNFDMLTQSFGRLALNAVEIYHAGNTTITAQQAIDQLGGIYDITKKKIRQEVAGIMAILLMNEITLGAGGQQAINLNNWATDLFYSAKVRNANAVLDEYKKWKADPCSYKADGYTPPPDCALRTMNYANLFATKSPPEDILGKAALKSVLSNNADAVASGVSVGITSATLTGSAIAVATGVGMTSTAASFTGMMTHTCLHVAFGGAAATKAGVTTTGAIGSVSWGGVVAAPIAAAVLAVVVGTTEGFRVVEAVKLEPMLKMKLGAALSEPVNIVNVMADPNSRDIFFIAFMEAAEKGFQIPQLKVDGEVRFYCQAGYVSNFRLTYTVNGQHQTYNTPDLSVGHERTFAIPYNATNIRLQGWYLSGTWKELFNVAVARPTYLCYTTYGTVFDAKYKTDCPEVGNMTTNSNELTVTQGGGYSAWIRLTYQQNNQTVTALDQNSTAAGWRKVFQIPVGATNIRLQAWSNTGLVWEPWKTIFDKTWPTPPNECIKVYGTSLEPRWNSECN